MPKVPAGMLPPKQVEEFAGLSRAALLSLSEATVIPALNALTPTAAIVARAMKTVFWTGPAVTRPGPEQQAIRTAALNARDKLVDLIETLDATRAEDDLQALAQRPEYACVVIATGKVYGARNADGAFDAMRLVTDPWLCLPLGAWKRDAEATWPEQTPSLLTLVEGTG